jgi:hypothetical protein
MPIDLTGVQNVSEFYSHHYLGVLLAQDLKDCSPLSPKLRLMRKSRSTKLHMMRR